MRLRLLPAVVGLMLGLVAGVVAVPLPTALAAPCDPPITNPVACENTKPGDPASEWEISGAGSSSIQGFATDISVDQGQAVRFKVDTNAQSYRLDIYRMGYYGGLGARRVATVQPSASLPQNQPNCLTDSGTGLVDCGNWAESASWAAPADAVSGIYFAHLVRTDGTSGESHIYFVVRDDDGGSDLLFQTSDTTWQAYNDYGGNSLYEGSPAGRAYKVSYNRPFDTRAETPEDFVWNAEYPMVRFLEANGYDVSYTTGVDSDRRGSLIQQHKVFLSVGHDEYWSGGQRANVEAAREAGVNLAFFSGNEVFWKTRWEPSIDSSATAYRTLVTYKETHAGEPIDPQDPPTWTGTWRDPRFSPPADGGRPENGLTGTIFTVNCCGTDMEVNGTDGQMRFWRNTRVANLAPSGSTQLGSGTLGYEWDEDLDNGSRPAGLIRLSTTTVDVPQRIEDYGSSYGPGTATHHLTLYRAPSGALVFGAGTIQWSWGLDDQHDGGSGAADTAMQQATVNLLADMGAQPDTRQSELVAATASTDTTPPTSTITSPSAGATLSGGSTVTITGTASDVGGRVGGVEVSADGGQTWHPASGRESWTYSWKVPAANGTYTIRSRTTDDSARTETPTSGINVTVADGTPPPPPPGACPCSIWAATDAPDNPSENDGSAVELGVKFRAAQDGRILGVRFYKGSTNTGTHVGRLWTTTGTKLAEATFTNESASGWQEVRFSTPVDITVNTTYVASYFAPAGRYANDDGYFAAGGVTNGPLTALQDGIEGGNGTYRYGSPGGFPNSTYNATNYWVDVVYEPATDTTKPAVTNRSPADGATNVSTTAQVTATFSEPVQPSTIAFTVTGPSGPIAGSTAYDDATRTATFTPAAALAATTAFTASVSGAKDLAGNQMDPDSWSFTTASPDTTAPTVTSRTPVDGATGVPVSATVSVVFSEAVQASTVAMSLSSSGGAVTGATSYDPASRTATFTPASGLAGTTVYTAQVSGAKDLAGNTMLPVSWTFTTGAASACPCTIWPANAIPGSPSDSDNKAIEVGVKFRADRDGFITAIRFYKGTGNTGTHIGRLWTRSGVKLAEATFTNESGSGWQEVRFANPVQIVANTTYVASYFAPNGRYAQDVQYFEASETTRGPLTALRDGADGGNGVYGYGSSGGFPQNTFRASNYWVDVVFDTAAADTSKPTITSTSPAAGETGVDPLTSANATFSEPVQTSTINFTLTAADGATVTATTSYDAATRTATLVPSAALAPGSTYTARVAGATDPAGNVMDPVTWTFTTTSGNGCPCSIWAATSTPDTASSDDASAVELGVKFRADRDGFVTGIRFYKGAANTGTHTGSLWRADGTLMGSVTFSNETATGWQQALFATPIAVTANTTYVASYYAPGGGYALNSGYFAGSGVTRGPLTALADGTDGGNGVYRYGATGFPTDTFDSTNYWVDVVFDFSGTDTIPPTLSGHTPASGQSGVPATTTVTATLSEPVSAGSIIFELRGPGGTLVPATASYDPTTRTSTLTPDSGLAASTQYTATVSGATDAAGNVMQPASWSFSTAAPPPPPPDQGPGGPIAVVTSSSSPLTTFTFEMLRTEGLNAFGVVDLSTLTATALSGYDVVVLGAMPLSAAQETMFADWVNAGGNLVALRPDPGLATLLGLTPAGDTITDGYLKIDNATPAGAGITDQTIQFHGVADRYTLSGATPVATLYANATGSTPYPAVTLRDVGTSGGQAAAFTFDLARSVVQLRQGNPAWAGQERDGQAPIRSDDLYFGGSATDWVNLAKVAIPQADEQQRLLANLIEVMNRDRKPLPRFWYFPGQHKAAVVATGDDHGQGGTAGRFDQYIANSDPGCSVVDWECPRITSYVVPTGALTNTQAVNFTASGFEVGVHPDNGCTDFTPSSLEQTYSDDLAAWSSLYTGLATPVSNRFHCLVWSDWSSQAEVEASHGMRLDVNYYYWPGNWIQDQPGFLTGSGMPMRFTKPDGSMVNVYQAATQMTDESEQSYPFTSDTLLDNAVGPLGYYGYFTVNAHTDNDSSFVNDQVLASAAARGVPVITARQLLTWLDGRNGSSFGSLAWSGNQLSFTISVGAGANGLTAMVPTAGPGGQVLTSITRAGTPVVFTKSTIKGVEYALFSAQPGAHVATYESAPSGVVAVTALSADVQLEPDGSATADLTWQTAAPTTSEVWYGTRPDRLFKVLRQGGTVGDHRVRLDGLEPGQRYFYRVGPTEPARSFMMPKADNAAPRISGVDVLPLPDGTARVTWRTSEPADSRVLFGVRGPAELGLTQQRYDDEPTTTHDVVLTGLDPGTTYVFRVESSDLAGNRAQSSSGRAGVTSFTSSAAGVADQTVAQFRTGHRALAAAVKLGGFGGVSLAPGKFDAGSFTSRVMDAGAMVTWDRASWRARVPGGAAFQVSVRTGNRPVPDETWTDWQPLARPGARVEASSRYIQYRLQMVAGARGQVPTLTAIGFTHDGRPPVSIFEGGPGRQGGGRR